MLMEFIDIFDIIQSLPVPWAESSMIRISLRSLIIILHEVLAILSVYTSFDR